MKFLDRLNTIIATKKNFLCIGLDTDWRTVPEHLHRADNPVLEFNKQIIDATKDIAVAYKLNLAFYENFGEQGLYAMSRTLSRIPDTCITIADAKRGDIGNTATKYAETYLDNFGFDSITLSPYMGRDSIDPFIQDESKCAFILALTSNAGAKDFQYLPVNGKPMYKHVVETVSSWNAKKNCGLVVGATKPAELAEVRAMVPSMPLLIPGVGAQGASLRDTLKANAAGPALINSSRGIIGASRGEDFAIAARREAEKLVDEMKKSF